MLYGLVKLVSEEIAPRIRKRRRAARRRKADLAWRARQENAEYLANGVYEGQYPAYTMPLTRPTNVGTSQYDCDYSQYPDWSGIIRPN